MDIFGFIWSFFGPFQKEKEFLRKNNEKQQDFFRTLDEMPLYEYWCEECKKVYEIEQRVSEEPVRLCPRCGSGEFKRMISATSFVLKGSGWYKTDHTDYGKNRKKRGKRGFKG